MNKALIIGYDDIVDRIADLAHEKFRKVYREANNNTRMKTTKDKAWIKLHGTNQSDLAKLKYSDLPSDWKNERKSGSTIALDALIDANDNGEDIDDKFIERASDLVHIDWLKRNSNIAKPEHLCTYGQLSDEAKDKDRFFVLSAIEIYGTSQTT